MTLPRLEELRAYWSTQPPVHVSVAAYLMGDEKETKAQDFNSLMEAFPQKG